jgi:hypothetical protein
MQSLLQRSNKTIIIHRKNKEGTIQYNLKNLNINMTLARSLNLRWIYPKN